MYYRLSGQCVYRCINKKISDFTKLGSSESGGMKDLDVGQKIGGLGAGSTVEMGLESTVSASRFVPQTHSVESG